MTSTGMLFLYIPSPCLRNPSLPLPVDIYISVTPNFMQIEPANTVNLSVASYDTARLDYYYWDTKCRHAKVTNSKCRTSWSDSRTSSPHTIEPFSHCLLICIQPSFSLSLSLYLCGHPLWVVPVHTLSGTHWLMIYHCVLIVKLCVNCQIVLSQIIHCVGD